jgi:Concanavalin A-like lectin/glucanases superfamily
MVLSTSAQAQDDTAPTVSALQFDGTSSYVDVTPAVTSVSFGDFTISGWFNIQNQNGAIQYLFRFTDAESNVPRIQVAETGGTITADIRSVQNGTIYAISSTNFTYGNWVHIAFVRQADQLSLYFNGQLVGSQTAVATLFHAVWGFVGANTEGNSKWGVPANFYAGEIDEFQIRTNALSAQDISNSMSQSISNAAAAEPGLLAGYGLNERTGNLAYDASGNGFTAAIYNCLWTLPPPFTISNLQPTNGAIFITANNGIRFTVNPGTNGVDTNAISMTLNGLDVSHQLQITGNSQQWNVAYNIGFQTNRFYYAQINVTNRSGLSLHQTVSFDTFSSSNYTYEAEDFNFNGGQFIDNPPIDPDIYPNYFDELGVQDVDELVTTSVQPKLYRYAEPVGTDISPDVLRTQYIEAGLDDYVVTGLTSGEWLNYTRTFPDGHYYVYARLARNGSISAELDEVTSDAAQSNQTTQVLGWFKSSGTGSADAYQWVPLQDASGNLTAIDLNGLTTLRFTAQTTLNANFYMLVPATVQPPVVTSIDPLPGTTLTNASNGLTFTVLSPVAGVSSNGISVVINGINYSNSLTFTGNESAWNVRCGGLLPNTNYNVQISVVDNDGVDLGYPFTGTPLSDPNISFNFNTYLPGSNLALQFDGTNYVDITPALTGLTNVGDFTICGWYNIHDNGSPYLFRFTAQESSTRRIQIVESLGTITADIRLAGGGTIYAISSSAFSFDTWVHIAFVRQADQLYLYFNGQLVGSQTAVADPLIGVNRWGFLGASTYNNGSWGVPSSFFTGDIDNFEIWTKALTALEIQDSMSQPIAPAPSLLAGWEFNEGEGNVDYDSSGNNLTVTNYGDYSWVLGPVFNTTTPVLNVVRNGIQLTLTWDNTNDVLQSASDLTGPWTAVQSATSPYVITNDTLNSKQFFRLSVGN